MSKILADLFKFKNLDIFVNFKRVLRPIYEDNIGQPIGMNFGQLYNNNTLPLVREVSNRLANVADRDIVSDVALTHIVTVWGQYIDHDLGLTPQSKAISAFQGRDQKYVFVFFQMV